jgi:hypothetical protein
VAFIVIYDACVLFRAVLRERTDLAPENLERTKVLMNRALPDANVTGHHALIDSLELPDLDDRHVLAAAVRIGAQAIVTFNLDDFPATALDPLGLEAKRPSRAQPSAPRPVARSRSTVTRRDRHPAR